MEQLNLLETGNILITSTPFVHPLFTITSNKETNISKILLKSYKKNNR